MNIPINVCVLIHNEPQAMRLLGRVCEMLETQECGKLVVVADRPTPFVTASVSHMLNFRGGLFVEHLFNGDCAQQRNFAMGLLPKNEWFVFLDADEFIGSGFLVALQPYVGRQDRNVWAIHMCHQSFNSTTGIVPLVWPTEVELQNIHVDFQQRLLFNDGATWWKDKKHANVTGAVHYDLINAYQALIVHHKDVLTYSQTT